MLTCFWALLYGYFFLKHTLCIQSVSLESDALRDETTFYVSNVNPSLQAAGSEAERTEEGCAHSCRGGQERPQQSCKDFSFPGATERPQSNVSSRYARASAAGLYLTGSFQDFSVF